VQPLFFWFHRVSMHVSGRFPPKLVVWFLLDNHMSHILHRKRYRKRLRYAVWQRFPQMSHLKMRFICGVLNPPRVRKRISMALTQAQHELPPKPHRRFNPLTGEWILVSPQRTRRPWQGQAEKPDPLDRPAYDPACYLCPGNIRAGGHKNPDYSKPYVFTNDFPALEPDDGHDGPPSPDHLLKVEPETGICRVICYSPRHDLSLARMTVREVQQVVDAWQAEYRELGARPDIGHVQIFENRGAAMGCSNPHPHGQIWANRSVPTLPATEGRCQAAYLAEKGDCLLCRYLSLEIARGERIILQNETFVVLVPFWACWPFETLILPRQHGGSIAELDAGQKRDLAEVMTRLAIRYDNLFQTAFPYTMGLHQQPTDGKNHPAWHWHIHYLPPLLRSGSVKKFMVGYEMLAMPQRDLPPEACADRLRSLSETHYRASDP